MNINDSVTSILRLKGLKYREVSYSYNETINEDNIELTKKIEEKGDSDYLVILSVHLSSSQSFELKISLEGHFGIECDNKEMKDALINKNSVSILFPYIRSEITLITSQPNIQPIVLPPININSLLNQQ